MLIYLHKLEKEVVPILSLGAHLLLCTHLLNCSSMAGVVSLFWVIVRWLLVCSGRLHSSPQQAISLSLRLNSWRICMTSCTRCEICVEIFCLCLHQVLFWPEKHAQLLENWNYDLINVQLEAGALGGGSVYMSWYFPTMLLFKSVCICVRNREEYSFTAPGCFSLLCH